MRKKHNDINDNEIRIISSKSKIDSYEEEDKPHNNFMLKGLIAAVILLAALIVCLFVFRRTGEKTKQILETIPNEMTSHPNSIRPQPGSGIENYYISSIDTVVNGEEVTIYFPGSMKAHLQIGIEALNVDNAKMVMPAADIRKDNEGIVGTYVFKGELLSRGDSKAGYCAIINGEIFIGVADATPYLEKAIESGGYFFRQYPLVVGGSVVENNLTNSSFRKALAEINDQIAVVVSKGKMTMNEFSRLLTELGTSNAIYLVGSSSPGFVVDKNGIRHDIGSLPKNPSKNINFIVWE